MVEVLIVGAGPTGLTAACELARRGLSCRVIDQAAQPNQESRAFGIHSRTLEVMEGIGVLDRLLALGIQQRGLNLYRGGRRLHLDLTSFDAPYPFVLGIPQARLEQCLRDRLAELGVNVEYQTRFQSLSQGADGVDAELVDPEGRAHAASASWLLGCDGAKSLVRKSLGLSFEGTSYENMFMLLDADIEWDAARNESHIFSSRDGALVIVPMPNGWRIIVDTPIDVDGEASPAPTFEFFQQAMQDRGPAGVALGNPTWMAAFRIHRRLAGSYRRERVFLAGDACHVQSPIGAQGLNTGVQDAHNLAWKLALVQRGRARSDLLDSYEAERMPIARDMLQKTNALTSFAFSKPSFLSTIQNLLVGGLVSLPVVQRAIALRASQIGQHYRHSPIVCRASRRMRTSRASRRAYGPPPRPGDRAPDAVVQRADSHEPTRIFLIARNGGHALLVFLAGASDERARQAWIDLAVGVSERFPNEIEAGFILPAGGRAAIGRLPFPAFIDAAGEAHARYGERPGVYVVRPDGYVAYRSGEPDSQALVSYLNGVLVAGAVASARPSERATR